jgi:hypothetical protein
MPYFGVFDRLLFDWQKKSGEEETMSSLKVCRDMSTEFLEALQYMVLSDLLRV